MARWFKTQTHSVYHRPREGRGPGSGYGWSRKTSSKTRVKRWTRKHRRKLWRKAKRATKKQWRKAKQDVRRVRRKRQRQRAAANRRAARQYQREPRARPTTYSPRATANPQGQQYGEGMDVQYVADAQPAGERPPPPDGAVGTCRRCSYEVQYSGARQRWEHTGKGNADCFR